MILFSFPDYKQIAHSLQIPGVTQDDRFHIARYDNRELHAVVLGNTSGRDCSILGSIAPPDERMLSLTLLAHTLKQAGARQVTGILPYLAYTRQDKVKAGESLTAAWVGIPLEGRRGSTEF